MKDAVNELVRSRPEMQHSLTPSKSIMNSLFDDTDFGVGMGFAHSLKDTVSFDTKSRLQKPRCLTRRSS